MVHRIVAIFNSSFVQHGFSLHKLKFLCHYTHLFFPKMCSAIFNASFWAFGLLLEIAKQNKILKIITLVLIIACIFAIAVAHNYKTQLRMNEYAMDNNCEWNYSYYIDEEPVCK